MLRWHKLSRTNDNWKYLLKGRVLSKASSVDFKIKTSIVRFKIQLSLCLIYQGYRGFNNNVKTQIIRSVSLLASKCISSVCREMHRDCAAMPSIGRLFASSMCSQSPTSNIPALLPQMGGLWREHLRPLVLYMQHVFTTHCYVVVADIITKGRTGTLRHQYKRHQSSKRSNIKAQESSQ